MSSANCIQSNSLIFSTILKFQHFQSWKQKNFMVILMKTGERLKLYERFPNRFDSPELRGMLEVDWDEYITAKRRLYGGQYWTLTRAVAVYYNNLFVGSDEDLFDELTVEYKFFLPKEEDFYKEMLYLEYVNFLKKAKRVYCYMDIMIDEISVGSLTFQLYSELLPETCENFRCLCTGEMEKDENGIELNYKDSQIHRIVKTCWIQGGDIQNKNGGGGVAILSPTFPDESYCIGHDRRGVLSMANDGKHTNASQFFVTLQPMQWMDYYYVAFGQLVEGVEVLKAIEAVETYYEKPKQSIRIYNCGTITFEEKEIQATLKVMMTTSHEEVHKVISSEVLPSDLTLSSTHQFAKTIMKELITKATIGVPLDVPDKRDVSSLLEEDRYFMDMYSIEWNPHLRYTTPKDFLARKKSVGGIFEDLTEVIDETKGEQLRYYVEEKFSEGSLPVTLPMESVSDVTLKSSERTARAVLRELITNALEVSETGRRFVNMVLNDSLRMVRSYLNRERDRTPKVLAMIAGETRNVVNRIVGEAILKLWPLEEGDDNEEIIVSKVLGEVINKVFIECISETDIVNQVINELISKVVMFLNPSLHRLTLTDTSALEIAKVLFSDVVTKATQDISSILETNTISQSDPDIKTLVDPTEDSLGGKVTDTLIDSVDEVEESTKIKPETEDEQFPITDKPEDVAEPTEIGDAGIPTDDNKGTIMVAVENKIQV